MKQLQKIGIISWTIYFLFSITGISVQQLYCHCLDKGIVAPFFMEHDCKDHHKTKKVAKKSCCSKKAVQANQNNQNCCDANTQFIKADIAHGVVPSFSFIDFNSNLIGIFSSKIITPQLYIPKDQITSLQYYRPPPKPYGFSLLKFISSYLC